MSTNPGRQVSAYYRASVDEFLSTHPDQVIGRPAAANPFALDPEQRDAWQEEIQALTAALQGQGRAGHDQPPAPAGGR